MLARWLSGRARRPQVLYPLLGVSKASELAHTFFDGTSFLFVAG